MPASQPTVTEMRAALDVKIEPNAVGLYECPWPGCDRILESPNALGPHRRAHAERAGLYPVNTRRSTAGRGLMSLHRRTRVECPRCDRRVMVSSMTAHLVDTHHVPRSKANELTHGLVKRLDRDVTVAAKISPSTDVVVAETPPKPRIRQVSVDDAAVAVLLGTTGAETIAVTDVPMVADWLQHTRAVVSHLTADQ